MSTREGNLSRFAQRWLDAASVKASEFRSRTFPQPRLKLTPLTVSLLIIVVGTIVYFWGLTSPFQGDDTAQIVTSVPVHSVRNVPIFFEGSTFYNGNGIAPLSGSYYRPLMLTVFSSIYSTFGPNPLAFHIVQLTIFLLSAIMLYLILACFVRPTIALGLSLVFVVHPMVSQIAFSISASQDALFLLFGLTGFWLLVRFQDRSAKYLVLASLCFVLSMLSKETGILFVAVALLYVLMTDRKRIVPLLGLSAIGVAGYMLLRIHAIGLINQTHLAPIDNLNLWQRLLNTPSIIAFYLTGLVYPLKLSQGYYWAYTTITFRDFFLPLILLGSIGTLVIMLALYLRKERLRRHYILFMFFGAWFVIGLSMILQIVPLDMTACDTWFCFSLVGLLGMAGVVLDAYPFRLPPWQLLATTTVIVGLLALRTFIWGFTWDNPNALAYQDLSASPNDYVADDLVAYDLVQDGSYYQAKTYANRALRAYKSPTGYNTLGLVLMKLRDFSGARGAFMTGLAYGNLGTLDDNLAILSLWYGSTSTNINFISSALIRYPHDPDLWYCAAVLEENNGDNPNAKIAIVRAQEFGYLDPYAYQRIMADESVTISPP